MAQDVTVKVYDPTGVTLLDTFARVWDVQSTTVVSGAGVGRFTIHADDVQATEALLGDNLIVKFTYEGAEREGFVIKSRTRRVVDEGEKAGEVIVVAGPGLAFLLRHTPVVGEFGAMADWDDTRWCNYGSGTAEWKNNTAAWTTPVATASGSDARTALVGTNQGGWPTASANWIWPVDGSVAVTAGTVAFFRKTWTQVAEVPVALIVTGDDGIEIKVDGDSVITMTSVESRTYTTIKRYEFVLTAGTHVISARVDNQNAFDSPAGLLLALHELDENGDLSTAITVTDTSWECFAGPTVPGWRAANIARTLLADGIAYHAGTPAEYLTVDFTATLDSYGVAWADDFGKDRGYPVGSNLLETYTKLAEEGGFEWRVLPDMTIIAAPQLREDTAVVLAKASNLKGYETTSSAVEATRLLVRTRRGWLDRGDSAAETLYGAFYDFLSVGEVEDIGTAHALADTALFDMAYPQAAYTAEVAVVTGAVPFVDYTVGDTVTAPGEWGGTVTLRIRALTMVMAGKDAEREGKWCPVLEFVPVDDLL